MTKGILCSKKVSHVNISDHLIIMIYDDESLIQSMIHRVLVLSRTGRIPGFDTSGKKATRLKASRCVFIHPTFMTLKAQT